ncbi:Hypothetical predicted protein [Pelobates cultripes]|uniref:Uncharacterized protein n=1 Tax=Pelobates cultripes TaxID=61616 RepID=A0AAD1SIN5_PELCU|nr:Hypothetical predicted protein [Pelobates cultripes]
MEARLDAIFYRFWRELNERCLQPATQAPSTTLPARVARRPWSWRSTLGPMAACSRRHRPRQQHQKRTSHGTTQKRVNSKPRTVFKVRAAEQWEALRIPYGLTAHSTNLSQVIEAHRCLHSIILQDCILPGIG